MKKAAKVSTFLLTLVIAAALLFQFPISVKAEENSQAQYVIQSALNTNLVVDVSWGSLDDMANIQLYTSNDTDAQKFTIEYDGEGYATLRNVKSGKVLDVQWGKAANSSNVWQYSYNGSKAQKWIVSENEDGSVTFKSALNEKYVLDVEYGGQYDGVNVQIYESNGTAAQKFYIKKVAGDEPEPEPVEITLPAGNYYINSALSKYKMLDIAWGSTASGANVQIYLSNASEAQHFSVTYDKYGYATITNLKSGKVLDAQWGSAANGTNVWQYDSNGSTAQKWIIKKNSDDTYTICSALDQNYVVDVYFGDYSNATNVQLYAENKSAAQKFNFLTAPPSDAPAWVYGDEPAEHAIVEKAKAIYSSVTTESMTKEEKMWACFNELLIHYGSEGPNLPIPHYHGLDWPIVYANVMIADNGCVCFGYAALYGYLAKLCGCENVHWANSGTHGWVDIDGKVYDPYFYYNIVYGCTYDEARAKGHTPTYYLTGYESNPYMWIEVPEID